MLLLLGTASCSKVLVTLDDVIRMDGRETLLVAVAEREPFVWIRDGIEDAEMAFLVDGELASIQRTDHEGRAQLLWRLPETGTPRIEAELRLNGSSHRATADVFVWDDHRTVVAIDVDETLSATDYDDLLLDRIDKDSVPMPDAERVVSRLSERFHIVYLTARPRLLREKTRDWLDRHGFVRAPIVMAHGWSAVLDQAKTKRRVFALLQRQLPNFLVAIGDKQADVRASHETGVLPVIVSSRYRPRAGTTPETVVVRDWRGVEAFFEANRELLTRPARIRRVIEDRDAEWNRPPSKRSGTAL